MPEPPPPESPAAAPEPITQDLPCVSCGYNLRGLTVDRPCPECATPIGRSLFGDRLAFADPQWLGTIQHGRGYVLLGIVGYVLLLTQIDRVRANPPPAVRVVPFIALMGIAAYGAFLFTTLEPRTLLAERRVTLRTLIRACLITPWLGSSSWCSWRTGSPAG